MFRLMKLEIEKYSFVRIIRNAVIANLIIMIVFIGISFCESNITGEPAIFQHYLDAFFQTEIIIRAVFIIFEAVLIARLIVDEYRNKTIDVIFTYPINRKKIIAAKVLIIFLFSFSLLMVSNILVNSSFYIANMFLNIINERLTGAIVLTTLRNAAVSSISYSILGLIPLYFGVKKKSATTSIVTAIILMAVLNSGNETFKVGSVAVVYWGLVFVGAVIVYFYIKNVEKEDLLN